MKFQKVALIAMQIQSCLKYISISFLFKRILLLIVVANSSPLSLPLLEGGRRLPHELPVQSGEHLRLRHERVPDAELVAGLEQRPAQMVQLRVIDGGEEVVQQVAAEGRRLEQQSAAALVHVAHRVQLVEAPVAARRVRHVARMVVCVVVVRCDERGEDDPVGGATLGWQRNFAVIFLPLMCFWLT